MTADDLSSNAILRFLAERGLPATVSCVAHALGMPDREAAVRARLVSLENRGALARVRDDGATPTGRKMDPRWRLTEAGLREATA